MNTLSDPRTPSPVSATSRAPSTDSSHHPDLSNEVATLSTKLINAINHQTTLDDQLQGTRHELDAANERIAQLVAAAEEHVQMVHRGLLVKKGDVETMAKQLRTELAEERKRRETADKAKRQMDAELEDLTVNLFKDANTMVEDARRELATSERKNEQLRQQLNDTELLLFSHQEQLQDLKGVMQQMRSESDDNDIRTRISTAPSTPRLGGLDRDGQALETPNHLPNTPGTDDTFPDHPLHFSQLIRPVMRTDLQSYTEFQEMLKFSRGTPSHSRVTSLTALGISSITNGNSQPSDSPTNGSSPSLSNSPRTLPGSFASSSPRDVPLSSTFPLKDTRFYKRALTEDIEPALRLDLAPGLSWLAKRTVISSMTAGSLIVEPFTVPSKFYGPIYACSLCGEARKGDRYMRRHRFRTSDSDEAQRYPLCSYCLGRVRATCDFIGFLRMVRDGLWKAETAGDQRAAWEESVKLRERMFWSRLGGGVLPASMKSGESPGSPASTVGRRSVEFKDPERNESLDIAAIAAEDKKALVLPSADDPFHSSQKRVSIGNTLLSRPSTEINGAVDTHNSPAKAALPSAADGDARTAEAEIKAAEAEAQAADWSAEEDTVAGAQQSSLENKETLQDAMDERGSEPKADATAGAAAPAAPRKKDREAQKMESRFPITIPGAFE
ncbi:hypothetical protein BJ546DRAFT_108458 [Cryomyces antarcticus]|uniref:Rab guanine nucleotide exchange factor S2 n=1 Tax=Cryomyces antarcticus TaxID=329879 RepID=A0ABR0M823_9PEZI|nr:rab guanine nucleotide exchange factor S2 [Cryomyces antarcticus]KAK5291887.1 rab guanine nucleotide exchange factor S2 [Cryomyces antarcticus]